MPPISAVANILLIMVVAINEAAPGAGGWRILGWGRRGKYAHAPFEFNPFELDPPQGKQGGLWQVEAVLVSRGGGAQPDVVPRQLEVTRHRSWFSIGWVDR